jgi:hypothetical protein
MLMIGELVGLARARFHNAQDHKDIRKWLEARS